MTINYPLLLTLAEPGTLTGTYEQKNRPMPNDVYVADYQQGESLAEDRLSNLRKLVGKRRRDEVGKHLLPDGSMWVTVGDEICRYQNGKLVQTLPPLKSTSVSASTRGDFVWAIESEAENLWQWSAQTNRWDKVWGEGRAEFLHNHPSENKVHFVAYPSLGPGRPIVREWDADQKLTRTLDLPFQARQVKLSPDSKVLAFIDAEDDEVKTYELETGSLQKVSDFEDETYGLPQYSQYHECPQWSPDGRRLFYIFGTEHPWDGEDEIEIRESLMVATPDGAQRRELLDSGENYDGVAGLRI